MRLTFLLHDIPVSLESDDARFLGFFERFRRGWALEPAGEGGKEGIVVTLNVSRDPAGRIPSGRRPLFRYYDVTAYALGGGLLLDNRSSSSVLVRPREGTAVGRIARASMTYEGFTTIFSLLVAELLRPRGLFFLHSACLIDSGGTGWLLCGWPGAGKTTLSLGFLRAGCSFLSDDSVLLRKSGSRRVEALSLRKAFRVESGGKTKHTVNPERRFPGGYRERCTPGMIIHVELGRGRKSRLSRMSSSQSFLKLLPQSFQVLGSSYRSRSHVTVLRDLSAQCVSYDLKAGGDLRRAPQDLIRLVGERAPAGTRSPSLGSDAGRAWVSGTKAS